MTLASPITNFAHPAAIGGENVVIIITGQIIAGRIIAGQNRG